MKILGIDPGLVKTGWGVVDAVPLRHLAHGLIKPKANCISKRLISLQSAIEEVIKLYNPDVICIEKTYCGINPTTTLKLGFAYGVLLAAAGKYDIPVIEYPTRQIKQIITGNGSFDKEVVRIKIESMLEIKIEVLDVSDALAAALTHLNFQATKVL